MSARILIIEDDTALAETIRYLLSADGFRPEGCVTGDDAWTLLSQCPVDLILLDIGLPDTHGFDLFHRLRAITPAPVIFLTARSLEVDRVAGLELGADDYVTKPFSPRELLARIRTVLRRARRGPSNEREPPGLDDSPLPFTLDEEKRRIRYYGQTLDLTRYEYGILRLFLRRPGRIYSREELLAQVWEQPEESYDRTVDSHIRSLRAKLDAVRPGQPIIRTHRGLGYALDEDGALCAAA
jgi:two-component system catabolic regulation response regulator CreB